MLADIRSIIVAANHAYVAHMKVFRSKFLPKNVYVKNLIRPSQTCGSDAWTTTTEETDGLRIFERKAARKIHAPHKGRGIQENKNKQGEGHITKDRYCKIYKIPPD